MLIALLIVIAAVCGLWVLLQRCRRGHEAWPKLKQYRYAHRGYHSKPTVPENSMAAFRAAVERGWGAELDVHLMKDGNLAVIHDSLLNRTTGRVGHVEDLTTEQLKNYPLEGTDQTIPEFMDVLTLYNGKAPLIIELKPENGNQAALTEAACKMLETYKGVYCLESFDPRCLSYLKKHYPQVIRGQLSENYLKSRPKVPMPVWFVMTFLLGNFYFRPDFVAYKYEDRKNIAVFLARRLWKMTGVSWTLKTKEEYDQAVGEGWIPIFEGFEP